MTIDSSFEHDSLVDLLLYVADGALKSHRALLRGEVLPLGYPILAQSAARSLYVASPAAFPGSFATFAGITLPLVFVWLVPILPAEEAFIRVQGWSAFEALLDESEADLFNPMRPSVV